jgi:hypothetical protein
MSPELEAMLADEDTALALKRLYTYQRLRELNAPLPIIEKASSLLDESKKQLGSGYRILIHTVYEEYRQIEDTNIQSQEA